MTISVASPWPTSRTVIVTPAPAALASAAIAAGVIEALGITVGGPEQDRLGSQPTSDLNAYQAYLCGLRYRDFESPEHLGLAAAIPAVMGYNHFLNKVNVLIGEMDNFSQEFLNIVERLERGR